MKKLIECVPNFSEGRDMGIIKQITDAIESVDGIKLLNVDPGKGTNRTVVTFAGDEDEVVEAAFQAIKRASELIDMSKHSGEHPRFGATDVCPFIPIANATMEDCIRCAQRVGEIKRGVMYYRPEREAQVLRRLAELNPGPLSSDAVKTIFREVMSACLSLEQPLGIAFLELREPGPDGTFGSTEVPKQSPAIRKAFKGSLILNSDYDVALAEAALASGAADIAIRSSKQPTGAGLVGRRIADNPWTLYCSRDYAAANRRPRSAADLREHPIIGGGGEKVECHACKACQIP